MKEKIFLIPGLMTDERLWSRLKPHLENEYELIHFDLPISENFDEIAEALDKKIGEKEVNLLGFSLGGYVASYYTLKYPKKVKRLFLVSSTPCSTEEKDIKRREKKLQEAKKNPFKPLSLEKSRDLLEVKDEELTHIVANMYNDLGKETFITQLSSTLKRVDLFDELLKLPIPIKLFFSTKDRLLNHRSIKRVQEKEHNIKFVSRVGESHNIPLEFPKELSIEIRDWMKDERENIFNTRAYE